MNETHVKAAVVTVSDTRSLSNDVSGDRLVELLQEFGAEVCERIIVDDDLTDLTQTLHSLAVSERFSLIVTTGGTGFSPRDNTPEATRSVIEREAPGLAEAMRRETAQKTPMSMLSRAVCGIRAETLILNFPGSPKAVDECFEVIKPVLRHAIKLIRGNTHHDEQS